MDRRAKTPSADGEIIALAQQVINWLANEPGRVTILHARESLDSLLAAAARAEEREAALREALVYARERRGNRFDWDEWSTLCEAALQGGRAPSALENEIALHARTQEALRVVSERLQQSMGAERQAIAAESRAKWAEAERDGARVSRMAAEERAAAAERRAEGAQQGPGAKATYEVVCAGLVAAMHDLEHATTAMREARDERDAALRDLAGCRETASSYLATTLRLEAERDALKANLATTQKALAQSRKDEAHEIERGRLLHADLATARAAARCETCSGRGCKAGSDGGTGRVECADCEGTGYVNGGIVARLRADLDTARAERDAARGALAILAESRDAAAAGRDAAQKAAERWEESSQKHAQLKEEAEAAAAALRGRLAAVLSDETRGRIADIAFDVLELPSPRLDHSARIAQGVMDCLRNRALAAAPAPAERPERVRPICPECDDLIINPATHRCADGKAGLPADLAAAPVPTKEEP